MATGNTVGASTQAGPIGFGSTVGTTSGPVLGANPTRTSMWIYNPSTTVTVAICPAQVGLGPGTGATPAWPIATGVAVINGAGSITFNPGDKMLITDVNITGAFNGIASGSGGALTVWES